MIGYLRVDGLTLPIESVQITSEGISLTAQRWRCPEYRVIQGPIEVLATNQAVVLVSSEIISIQAYANDDVDLRYALRPTTLEVMDGTVNAVR